MNKSTEKLTPNGWLLGAAYNASPANTCPKCKGPNAIPTAPIEQTSHEMRQPMSCTDCSARWERLYRVTGYDARSVQQPSVQYLTPIPLGDVP